MFSLDYYQVFPLNQILFNAMHAWIDNTNWQNIVCVVAHRKVEIGSLKGYFKWEKKKRAENTCTPSITLMQTLAKENKHCIRYRFQLVIVHNLVDLWIDILILSREMKLASNRAAVIAFHFDAMVLFQSSFCIFFVCVCVCIFAHEIDTIEWKQCHGHFYRHQ